MTTRENFTRFSCLSLFFAIASASAQDAAENYWPQWRGPSLNGVSKATNLPAEWSDTKNVVWKKELPAWSGSTPIIWGDMIFTTSPSASGSSEQVEATPEQGRRGGGGRFGRGGGGGGESRRDPGGQTLQLFAINRANGDVLWSRDIDQGNQLKMKQNSSSPSPVTDGEHVWVNTGNGVLTCFDMEGNEVWVRRIQDDYGSFGLMHGYASSPLLYEDRLIVPVLHGMTTDDPSYVLAINKLNGETLWKTDRPTDAPQESPDAYVTPQLLELDERVEIVLNGGDIVTGHDMFTGEELWRADVLNPRNAGNYRIIPSALIVDDLIIAPSRINPMAALRTGGSGDISSTHVVWENRNGPDVPTPVSDGKYLWVITGDRSLISCLDVKTGEVLYDQERIPSGTYDSSLVLADGKIYVTNESGTTVVIAAKPEFELLATNTLEGGFTMSSPAIAGEQIFLRVGKNLYCIANLE